MPGLLALSLLAVFPLASAAPPAASVEILSNKLDVEAALLTQGVEQEVGVVFSFAVPGVPELQYDRIQGVERFVETEQTTVGFLQLNAALDPQTAIFRQGRGQEICMDTYGDYNLDAEERLAVYASRLQADEGEQARIVFGHRGDGQDVLTVWIEPGEQVTTVSAVDHRRKRKLRRTELRQEERKLTLDRTEDGARACYSRQ